MSTPALKIVSLKWSRRRAASRLPEEVASIPEGRVVETEPALLSVEQSARYLGVGRTQVFVLLREGRLRSVKVGRRRLIPRSELDRYITEEVEREQER